MYILLHSGRWKQWLVASRVLQCEAGQGNGSWKQWIIPLEQALELSGVCHLEFFLSFLTGERGKELMGLPIASVLCSKQLFSLTQVSSICPNVSQSRGFNQQKELTPFISTFPVLIDGKAAQQSQDIFLCCKHSLKYWDTPCCFGHFVSKRRGSEEASCDCRKTPCEKTLKSL